MAAHAQRVDRLLEQPRLGGSRMNAVAVGAGQVRFGMHAALESEYFLVLRVAGQAHLVVLLLRRPLEGDDLGLVPAICRVGLTRAMTGFA